MIRVLLVDDQTLVRQGFRVLLEAHEDIQVVGEAQNGKQAIEQVEQLRPDLVLLDVRMPEMDGVAVTQAICQQFKEVKVLILSTFNHDDYVCRAMQFGAMGYLLKDTRAEELVQAIRMAHQGYTQLGPGLLQKVLTGTASLPTEPSSVENRPVTEPPPELPPSLSPSLSPELQALTKREREVLSCIITGATNREIAKELFISERTVKNHVTSILNRLNVSGRVQAAMVASPFIASLKSNDE
ncbi:MAG: response regulator transcription factor [Cyanobacteria bacterium J06553_1]